MPVRPVWTSYRISPLSEAERTPLLLLRRAVGALSGYEKAPFYGYRVIRHSNRVPIPLVSPRPSILGQFIHMVDNEHFYGAFTS